MAEKDLQRQLNNLNDRINRHSENAKIDFRIIMKEVNLLQSSINDLKQPLGEIAAQVDTNKEATKETNNRVDRINNRLWALLIFIIGSLIAVFLK